MTYAAVEPGDSRDRWFVRVESDVLGPLNIDDLRAERDRGRLVPNSRVCQVGAEHWSTASEVEQLVTALWPPPAFSGAESSTGLPGSAGTAPVERNSRKELLLSVLQCLLGGVAIVRVCMLVPSWLGGAPDSQSATQVQATVAGAVTNEPSVHTPDEHAISAATSALSRQLRAPATASWPRTEIIAREHPYYIVGVSVDAQNGFGALIRSHYLVAVKLVGNDQYVSSPIQGVQERPGPEYDAFEIELLKSVNQWPGKVQAVAAQEPVPTPERAPVAALDVVVAEQQPSAVELAPGSTKELFNFEEGPEPGTRSFTWQPPGASAPILLSAQNGEQPSMIFLQAAAPGRPPQNIADLPAGPASSFLRIALRADGLALARYEMSPHSTDPGDEQFFLLSWDPMAQRVQSTEWIGTAEQYWSTHEAPPWTLPGKWPSP
jgi:hypothetical protein